MLRIVVLLVCLVLLAPVTVSAQTVRREYIVLTFYNDYGPMRWGGITHIGAAACGDYFPPGSQLTFEDGWTVTCEDTGYLAPAQVDVYAPTYTWGVANVEHTYSACDRTGCFAWVRVARWGWQ